MSTDKILFWGNRAHVAHCLQGCTGEKCDCSCHWASAEVQPREQLIDGYKCPVCDTPLNIPSVEQQLAEARAQGMRNERLRCENIVIAERLRHGGTIALDACDRILEAIGVIEVAERAAEGRRSRSEGY